MSEKIASLNMASSQFMLRWRSSHASRNAGLFGTKVNFLRDLSPSFLHDILIGVAADEERPFISLEVRLAPSFNHDSEFSTDQWQSGKRFAYPEVIKPRLDYLDT